MLKICTWAFPVALLVVGCAKAPQPALATAVVETGRESRVLCLAEAVPELPSDQALQGSQTIARGNPDNAEHWVAVGREWVRKARLSGDPGFYLNVEGCAGEALATTPGFIPALELRTLVLLNDHQFEQARALAAQIISREPRSPIANGSLSDALLELGRYQEAAQAQRAQMAAAPGMAANARASHLHWLMGDTRSAKLFIRDALLERDAGDPEAAAWTFVEAGMIYWHQGDYSGADAIFSEALRWLPDYPAALVGRGRVALAEGRAQAAITFLARAQRLRPLAETGWLLGDAQALAGDLKRAQLAYQDVERQGRRGDRFTLALFLASKGRNAEEAIRMLVEERRHRGGVYLDDAYAWALYRAGKFTEARRLSQQAMRFGTPDARLIYHAGAIELAAGNAARGRKLIAQALALNPGFDLSGAEEARQLLAGAATRPARS